MRLPNRSRLLALAALSAGLIAVIALVQKAGGDGHRVVVAAREARYMRPGLEVRIAGNRVGAVESAKATRQGTARVELHIDDDAWPLPAGTTAAFRWAGTIAFTNRYVELTLPRSDGAMLPDGGTITGADVTPTVELDQIARVFDDATRQDLRRLLSNGSRALQNARPDLPRALEAAPPALEQARAVMDELGADREALGTLVRAADGLVHAIDSSAPGTRQLLSDGATTMRAVASRTAQLEQTLRELPPTLGTARETLARANGTLRALDGTLRQLDPGVVQVRRISRPLTNVLRTAENVVPQARSTLASLRRATSDLDPLLDRTPALLDRLTSVGGETARQLDCIRPYTPELAGLASTWSGFLAYGDDKDKYARVTGGVVPQAFHAMPVNSADFLRLVPGQGYGFPRPPGLAAGQPWFLSECGVGPESVDATKDPEAIR